MRNREPLPGTNKNSLCTGTKFRQVDIFTGHDHTI
jgi:hypothetical protein